MTQPMNFSDQELADLWDAVSRSVDGEVKDDLEARAIDWLSRSGPKEPEDTDWLNEVAEFERLEALETRFAKERPDLRELML